MAQVFKVKMSFFQKISDVKNYVTRAASDATVYLTSSEPYSKLHTGASNLVSDYISPRLSCEKKTIAVELHPLQSLYSLLERSVLQQQQIPDLRQKLHAIP